MGHILLGVLALDGQVRVFSPSHRAKLQKVACLYNRGAWRQEAGISVGIHPGGTPCDTSSALCGSGLKVVRRRFYGGWLGRTSHNSLTNGRKPTRTWVVSHHITSIVGKCYTVGDPLAFHILLRQAYEQATFCHFSHKKPQNFDFSQTRPSGVLLCALVGYAIMILHT